MYVRDRFALLELDLIKVLGRIEPELIYTLLGGVSLAEDSTFRALKEMNGEMLSCYRAGNWEGALKALAACRTLHLGLGLDEFLNLYEERTRAFETNPPPADWNGVFEASFK